MGAIKTILFYSSVKDKKSFETQRFYRIDIEILEELGYKVILTNKMVSFLKEKYDIAFLYFYRKSVFPALISRFLGKKVYFTGGIDDLDRNYASKKNFIIQKYLFKICRYFSTKCIIVSEADLSNVRNVYNNNPSKLCLSRHTIDVDKFALNSNSKDEKLFTTIVWMDSQFNVIRKGVDISLKIFQYLLQKPKFHNSKYVIIGKKGEGTIYLKECISELGLLNNVIFTDAISEEDKIMWLRRSTYYFQVSIYEGFGIAALEALASKNIVIHSANGGLKATMKDYGVIVDRREVEKGDLNRLYNSLCFFDLNILDEGTLYVKNEFSNKKRKKEFESILK